MKHPTYTQPRKIGDSLLTLSRPLASCFVPSTGQLAFPGRPLLRSDRRSRQGFPLRKAVWIHIIEILEMYAHAKTYVEHGRKRPGPRELSQAPWSKGRGRGIPRGVCSRCQGAREAAWQHLNFSKRAHSALLESGQVHKPDNECHAAGSVCRWSDVCVYACACGVCSVWGVGVGARRSAK